MNVCIPVCFTGVLFVLYREHFRRQVSILWPSAYKAITISLSDLYARTKDATDDVVDALPLSYTGIMNPLLLGGGGANWISETVRGHWQWVSISRPWTESPSLPLSYVNIGELRKSAAQRSSLWPRTPPTGELRAKHCAPNPSSEGCAPVPWCTNAMCDRYRR